MFNATTIRRLLSRRRPSQDRECPTPPHWWLGDLGRKLDMPVRTLHTWLRRGWLHSKQSAGAHGRWILWADDDELERLKQLREDGLRSSGLPAAAELTTPKSKPEH